MRNLGVIFDANLSFDSFVQSTVKTSFFHLRNIARSILHSFFHLRNIARSILHSFFHLRNIARSILHHMLNFTVAEMLINSFVVSRLDYCNASLTRVSKSTLNKLQYVQNSAARILTETRIVSHITPVLQSLHWLLIRFRVGFKITMLTFKALHGLASHYLTELLHPYTPNLRLRSSQSNLLVVPQTRLRSMGDRAFSFYAPVLWNSLPLEFREVQNYDIFKVQLKGIVHPKMKILSSFTHLQVVPNLYECLCSAEHKGRYSEE